MVSQNCMHLLRFVWALYTIPHHLSIGTSEELVRQMERANWFQRVQFQKQWQTARITELQSQVEELLAVNATQAATIEALRTRVAELEAHSGLASH